MKILLLQAMGYFISYSGACKANRFLMEDLSGCGHECRVITVAPNDNGLSDAAMFQELLDSGEIKHIHSGEVSEVYESNGVEVHSIHNFSKLDTYVLEIAKKFAPDWVLVTEDRVPELLRLGLEAAPDRVVELAHSQVALPFGPECYEENPEHADLLKQTAGIIASSSYVKDYLLKWGSLESIPFPFPVHGRGPFHHYDNFENGFITMINPSDIKGLPIFLELAKRFPNLPFAAVPTWATTSENIRQLEALPNVTLLPRVNDIDEILKKTRILIVPSLWGEAFGAIIVDGMLRGIPVLASHVGGTSEAKLQTDYLIPVNPIVAYKSEWDERLIPIPVIPEQDLTPWFAAVERLVSDREHYKAVSNEAKNASDNYLSKIDPNALISYFEIFAGSESLNT
ncbi:glycosyltransferase [Paenibacillus sp. NPDC058071]|uniref:glycosyltransferase n=1 Tax=Paenibacillus sp. NPDC058071 TaxID=3346326 RepID=UPI0036DEAC41